MAEIVAGASGPASWPLLWEKKAVFLGSIEFVPPRLRLISED